jgi:hypothetical protein
VPFKHEEEAAALEQLIDESAALIGDGTKRHWEEAQPVSAVARDRALEFLRTHASQARSLGRSLPLPQLSAGPDGSVDAHWTLGGFELLVNFPANSTEPATFYGDNEGNDSIRGTIGSGPDSRSLLPWLVMTQ